MPYLTAIRETLSDDDDQRTIAEHEVLIEFTCSPFVRATWDSPAEGGELEFIGAEVMGNNGPHPWVRLRPGDPLYEWAGAYFDANPNEATEAACQSERDDYYDRADRAYDAWKDRQMEDRAP